MIHNVLTAVCISRLWILIKLTHMQNTKIWRLMDRINSLFILRRQETFKVYIKAKWDGHNETEIVSWILLNFRIFSPGFGYLTVCGGCKEHSSSWRVRHSLYRHASSKDRQNSFHYELLSQILVETYCELERNETCPVTLTVTDSHNVYVLYVVFNKVGMFFLIEKNVYWNFRVHDFKLCNIADFQMEC